MTKTNLSLDANRLWADIMALAEITDPARPWTRRSFTALFLEGRAWLANRFAEAGLVTRIDTSGNLIGRLEGQNPALGVIAIGSHSDSVPSGGRFDGMAGLASGLAMVGAVRDARCRDPAAAQHRGDRFPGGGAERIRARLHRQPRHGRRARAEDAR